MNSSILSSRSLIRSSASVFLLLITSSVFFISFIVLFISVCLLFNYSRCLFFNCSRSSLNISHIFSIFASILFPRSWIIFTISILNPFSGRLPISTSFNFFLAFCSFIWYIALCLFILPLFLWMSFSFHRLQDCSYSCFCCLPSRGWGYLRGLCMLPDGRDWWWVELGVALVGRAQ